LSIARSHLLNTKYSIYLRAEERRRRIRVTGRRRRAVGEREKEEKEKEVDGKGEGEGEGGQERGDEDRCTNDGAFEVLSNKIGDVDILTNRK